MTAMFTNRPDSRQQSTTSCMANWANYLTAATVAANQGIRCLPFVWRMNLTDGQYLVQVHIQYIQRSNHKSGSAQLKWIDWTMIKQYCDAHLSLAVNLYMKWWIILCYLIIETHAALNTFVVLVIDVPAI